MAKIIQKPTTTKVRSFTRKRIVVDHVITIAGLKCGACKNTIPTFEPRIEGFNFVEEYEYQSSINCPNCGAWTELCFTDTEIKLAVTYAEPPVTLSESR